MNDPTSALPRQDTPAVPGVRIHGVLGRGGFATVYSGTQVSLQREVAIKIDSRPLNDERNQRRFHREMGAASRISGHPHVVTLIDAGVLPDTRPYLVMERCDGGSLATLTARGPLLAADAVRIVEAVSSALGAAHAAGVLHRDIKPANILIDAYGTPRLSDFGIAAIQRDQNNASVTLEALTPAYAPPEAFNLAEPTASGDVWSMGAVLLALVTGRGPRQGADGRALSLPEIMHRLTIPVDTRDPRLPPALRSVIDRAMQPNPSLRYRDGSELTAALAAAAKTLGGGKLAVSGASITARLAAPAPTPPPPPAATAGRTAKLLGLGILIGATVTGGAIWAVQSLQTQSASGLPTPSTQTVLASSTATPVQESSPALTPTVETSTSTTATPSQVNASGIPYADGMTWPVGTCLSGSVTASGVSAAQVTSCDTANWIVFAGGTLDPSSQGTTASEAMSKDPQVGAICTTHYAQLAGLDINASHTIKAIGPTDDRWTAGNRIFSCIYIRG